MKIFKDTGGVQSWDGPYGCSEDARLYSECEGSHLHCDGPLPGDRVLFVAKSGHHDDGPGEHMGSGMVLIHWHYEGCMINVQVEDGTRAERSLCPELGDRVEAA